MLACLRSLTVFGLIAVLTACGSNPKSALDSLPLTPQASIEQQLQQAAKSKPQEAAQLRLAALEQASAQGQMTLAQNIQNQIDTSLLTPQQQTSAHIIRAELALYNQKPQQALSALKTLRSEQLNHAPQALQVRAHSARAKALDATGQPLAAARERVYLGTLLKPAEQQANNEYIWASVSALSDTRLRATGDKDLDGWLQLALMSRQGTLKQQQTLLKDWLASNPEHPAAINTPTALDQQIHLKLQAANQIALLLPQSGPLASVARALRDGFISAQLQSSHEQTNVKIYDSARFSSMQSFYAQAAKDGIDLVVGPLEKPLVKQLAARPNLPITTLALNYADADQQAPSELYQFGLAAEDEAREAARRAWADGHTQALALVPKGEWGERVLAAFTQHFTALGGSVNGYDLLDQPVQLAQQVATLFRLQAPSEQSLASASEAAQNTPTRREDVDFLFLAATPEQAQQVRPTLVFQYVGDVPVYATSHLFTGNLTAAQLKDLDGIRFCETPWLLNPQAPLQQQISAQWPQANSSLGRLYAMGVDAYQLTQELSHLSLGGHSVEGYTGILRLGQQQRIERQLPWAEIRDGHIQPLAESF